MMCNENLENILEDKEFLESILKMQTKEEILSAFKEKGVEITEEELYTVAKTAVIMVNNDNKIPDEILENISGGLSVETTKKIKNIAKAVAVTAVGVGGTYLLYQTGKAVSKIPAIIDKKTDKMIGLADQHLSGMENKLGENVDQIKKGIANSPLGGMVYKPNPPESGQGWFGWFFGGYEDD